MHTVIMYDREELEDGQHIQFVGIHLLDWERLQRADMIIKEWEFAFVEPEFVKPKKRKKATMTNDKLVSYYARVSLANGAFWAVAIWIIGVLVFGLPLVVPICGGTLVTAGTLIALCVVRMAGDENTPGPEGRR